LVGITGSCGKTTTKEMIRRAAEGSLEVLATRGNLNNLFGLPLMLLELTPAHQAAVLEMGISTPGEMAPLTAIARPDVAVLLNIAEVHLAHFASLDDLAATKLQILEGLRPGGTMIYNADDPRLAAAAARHAGARVSFGLGPTADFTAGSIRDLGEEGIEAEARAGDRTARLRLRVPGRHNLLNALAALAAATVLGVPLAEGAARLAGFRPLPMRGARRRLRGDVVLWDESYNSNPAALRAVLAALAAARPRGRRILVSGDMLELGREERAIHAALAEDVARAGVDLFIGVGPLSALTAERLGREFRIEAVAAPDAEAAGRILAARVGDHDLVVVKGSRAMATEKAAAVLEAARPEEP
jgi:UDP-N-acetylmuramoyl-tripeptide--D-alanyl-D-alanine ligase